MARVPAARLDNAELWAGLFWLGVSLFVVSAGRDLGVGTVAAPGSGFLLFWAGLPMCGFSLALVVAAVRQGSTPLASLWAETRWTKVLVVIAGLVAYGALLDTAGFLFATVPLLLLLLRAVDPVRGSDVEVEICNPVFVDPLGERLRG